MSQENKSKFKDMINPLDHDNISDSHFHFNFSYILILIKDISLLHNWSHELSLISHYFHSISQIYSQYLNTNNSYCSMIGVKSMIQIQEVWSTTLHPQYIYIEPFSYLLMLSIVYPFCILLSPCWKVVIQVWDNFIFSKTQLTAAEFITLLPSLYL